MKAWIYRVIAREVSRLSRYADALIELTADGDRAGTLLAAVDAPVRQVARLDDPEAVPVAEPNYRRVILLNGTFNHSLDIQALLIRLHGRMGRGDRVSVIVYNSYLAWLFRLADRLGWRHGPRATTFITRTDLHGLARLSGFDVVRLRPAVYAPWHFFGLGTLLNRLMPSVPGLRWLSLVAVTTLRPIRPDTADRPSLSIVIPARNERGNIEDALRRMPDFRAETEIIFVEGNSSDGTWEEIERVAAEWHGREGRRVVALRQTGRGKADAVRLGFSRATGDVLTILDADLTMPPELLPRFFDAYCAGLGDFINGTRLVYPMEGEAMQFLNRLANIGFAKGLSWILETPLADTLCGTKLLARRDYERFVAWRSDFGDFDPFGDFELLFPASVLGLGVIDVPVAYRARTYGTTNIHRFRDGLTLARMSIIGFLHIRLGAGPR